MLKREGWGREETMGEQKRKEDPCWGRWRWHTFLEEALEQSLGAKDLAW